jgi:hypothetical protein
VVEHRFSNFESDAQALQASGDRAAQIMDTLWRKRCGRGFGAPAKRTGYAANAP